MQSNGHALLGVTSIREIGRRESCERNIGGVDPNRPCAIEQTQLTQATNGEDLIWATRREQLEASVGVAQRLNDRRGIEVIRKRVRMRTQHQFQVGRRRNGQRQIGRITSCHVLGIRDSLRPTAHVRAWA